MDYALNQFLEQYSIYGVFLKYMLSFIYKVPMNINNFYMLVYYMETLTNNTEIITINIDNDNDNDNDNGIHQGYPIKNEVIKPKSPRTNPKKSYRKRVYSHELNYNNFIKHNLELSCYLIGDLKVACKMCKEKITGTKPVLMNRLTTKYQTITQSIKIQSLFRGYYVRLNNKLRGSGFMSLSICNNTTDFCTLEPLEEIEHPYFFSYTDKNNFTYGFNISSLIYIYKLQRKIKNPYNRDLIPKNILKNIFIVYYSNFILHQGFKQKHLNDYLNSRLFLYPKQIRRRPSRHIHRDNSTLSPHHQQQLELLTINRNKSYELRIREVFIEINRLEIYCDQAWVISLTPPLLRRFYIFLTDLWFYRSNIPYETKYKICYLTTIRGNPFDRNIRRSELFHLDENELKDLIIYTMENMVFTVFDEDFKKIGCFHLMTALTSVSSSARRSLPYLYETIQF